VVYTGNQSYHFYVNFEPIMLKYAQRKVKGWVRNLPVDFLDYQVTGDLGRLGRPPYTYHTKTGQFSCVIPNTIFGRSLEEINKTTQHLSTNHEVIQPQFHDHMNVLCDLLKIEITPIERRDALTRHKGGEKNYPPCIQSCLEHLKTTGELTHFRRLHLTAFMNKIRKTTVFVRRLYKKYAKDYNPRTTTYQIERIFRAYLKCYSCANFIAMKACPLPNKLQESCPYWPSINIFL